MSKITKNGFSLVETLIGLGILTLAGSFLAKHLVSENKFQSYSSLRANQEALKRQILHTTHCRETMRAAGCPTSGFVQLIKLKRDGSPSVFVSNKGRGTRLGGYTVRAECDASNSGLIIRAARLKSMGTLADNNPDKFFPDPQTKKVTPWSSPGSLLFPPGISLCAGARTTGLGPPQYESAWTNLPATFPHNLGTTDYVIFPLYRDAQGKIYEDHEYWDITMSSSRLKAVGESRVDMTKGKDVLTMQVYGHYRDGGNVQPNWTKHKFTQVKVRIWRLNGS